MSVEYPERIIGFRSWTDPVGWQRPANRKGGGRMTPAKTRSFQAIIQADCRNAMIGRGVFEAFDGPVSVVIDLQFPMPARWPAWKRSQMMGAPHCQTPDADNVAKAVLDALQPMLVMDDKQVWSLSVKKYWGLVGSVGVRVQA